MIISKLFLDNNHTKNPNGSLTKARNVKYDDNFVNYTNEEGFTKLHTYDYDICGIISASTELIVFCTNSNGIDQIHRVNSSTSILLLQGDLGFSIDTPINGVHQYNNKGDLIFSFNDTNNPIRIFNADNPYMELNEDKTFADIEAGINLLRLSPKYIVPAIVGYNPLYIDVPGFPSAVIAGEDNTGSLPKGAFQFTISYYLDDYDRLNWTLPSQVLFAHNTRNNDMRYYANTGGSNFDWLWFDDRFQDPSETLTDKGLYISISNLDTSFKKYKLAMIHRTATSVTVYDMGDHNTTVSSHHIVETSTLELSIDDVTVPYVAYEKVQDITISNNRLTALNATSEDTIDYQKYANNIKVTYNAYDNPSVGLYQGYRLDAPTLNYDEVYALNIGLIGKDGLVKGIFHIPGRASIEGDITWSPSLVNNAADSEADDRYLAYWENQNEAYPNTDSFEVWDVDTNGDGVKLSDLGGTNVRHHKMPDMVKIYKPIDNPLVPGSTILSTDNPILLNLDFSNIKFPKEILSEIQGFFIAYSNRDSSNSTVLGYQPLIRDNFWKDYVPNIGTDGSTLDGTFGGSSIFGLGVSDFSNRVYRFNDFGIMNNKPAIANAYLQPLFWSAGITLGQIDHSINVRNIDSFATDVDRINVLDYKYVPNDNAASTPSNEGREEALLLSVDTLIDDNDSFLICALKSDKQDLYYPFYNRKVSIASSTTATSDDVYEYSIENVVNFDCYFSHITSLYYRGNQNLILNEDSTIPETREDGDSDNDPTTIMNSYDSFIVSTVNADMKNLNITPTEQDYEDSASWIENIVATKQTDSFYYRANFNVDPSKDDGISYDNHFSFTNSIVPYYTFNHNNAFVKEHPHRVIRSAIQSTEALSLNWRYFSALEYYEMPKHRGDGVSIQSQDAMLLIHMEHSLFIAKFKDKVSIDTGDAYIGTSDIFDRNPEELLPTTRGTAGIQSRFGNVISEYGYTFADTYDNTIYNYSNNGLITISDKSAKEIMRKYLTNATGNPLTSNDVIFGADHINSRLIVTNIGDNPFTLSYCYKPGKEGWVSYHDYIPAIMVNNRAGTYSVNRDNLKELYEFNTGDLGTYYDTKRESYIDVLVNENPKTNKVINSVSMMSGVDDEANNIAKLFIYNKNQCTDIITLEEFTGLDDYDKIRYLEEFWHYGFIRDHTSDAIIQSIIDDFGNINSGSIQDDKQWYELSDIYGRFFIVRLIVDNSTKAVFRDLEYNLTLNRR